MRSSLTLPRGSGGVGWGKGCDGQGIENGVRVLRGSELAVWDQREARMQETDLVSGGGERRGAFF